MSQMKSAISVVCAKSREWERELEMRDSGALPDVISYCAKVGRWKPVVELLDEMRDRALSPAPVSYGATISAYEKARSRRVDRRRESSANCNNEVSNPSDVIAHSLQCRDIGLREEQARSPRAPRRGGARGRAGARQDRVQRRDLSL